MEAIRLSRKKQFGASSEKTYPDGMEQLNRLFLQIKTKEQLPSSKWWELFLFALTFDGYHSFEDWNCHAQSFL